MSKFMGVHSFESTYHSLGDSLLREGAQVDTGHWQAMEGVPMTRTIELSPVVLSFRMPQTVEDMRAEVAPNLPWADEHFDERVSGKPLNPAPSHVRWPFAQAGNEAHMDDVFSHTYPERMWPKRAGGGRLYGAPSQGAVPTDHAGIRYRYGDLNDVVALLAKQPHTRQAWLPIWFPEDTGAVEGQRLPCTLGYQFLLRKGKLNMSYHMRSTDLKRHFKDDIYMAMRLARWVLDQLTDDTYQDGVWSEADLGTLFFTTMSLHVFEGDLGWLRREFT